MEVPRLVKYSVKDQNVEASVKQSMTETYIPRMLKAGGKLMPNTRVRRLARVNGKWRILVERDGSQARQTQGIYARTVFVACGAVQTPALLRRSGFKKCVGQSLAFHPMIKVIAQFPDEMNPPGALDPIHQVKEFDPRFSMGCSVSSRPLLALTMMDHPTHLASVQHYYKHMGLYYTQTAGGYGSVHVLPGYRDPLVRVTITKQESQTLAEALRRLCECLFAGGADVLYPGIAGFPALHGEEDLRQLPVQLPKHCANLSTLHLFSSCPMGQDRQRCVTDSWGRVYDADDLYISDSSILCGPTIVNPQGTVMAVARRNVMEFLQRSAS
jgi:choline dehydrogenase-like flavoprotein